MAMALGLIGSVVGAIASIALRPSPPTPPTPVPPPPLPEEPEKEPVVNPEGSLQAAQERNREIRRIKDDKQQKNVTSLNETETKAKTLLGD